jgi:predicted MPP superfamily phosphohydrolase
MRLFIATLFATIIVFFMPDRKNTQSTQPNIIEKPIFSFGIIADIQYADIDPAGSRFYRNSIEKLRNAVSTLKSDSVDFLINLGDMIDNDYASFKPVMEIINSSGIKTYNIAGNHDFSIDSQYKQRIPFLSDPEDGFYSFSYQKFRFILLDGNDISTYKSKNKKSIKQAEDLIVQAKNSGDINGMDWNGGIGSNQISWLNLQLEEAMLKNEKVFLICHFPVFPESTHNLLNYKEILPILTKYKNIIAWLNGHNHEGNYGKFNTVHCVTFKGMVDTEETNSYALVEVYDNKLIISGYGREKSRILTY